MGYREQVIADGATGYWRLEEASGTSVASEVGSHPGTISGGVTLAAAGVAGGLAMRFNGTDGRISMGDDAAFEFTGAFTIEFWIKYTSNGNFILSKLLSSLGGWFIGTTAGNAIQFFAGTAGGATVFNCVSVQAYNDGAWHHMAAVSDGVVGANRARLYVDGVLAVQATINAGAIDQNAAPFQLGTAYLVPSVFFGGTLDEVAVYPLALTAAQVAQHYSLGLPRTYRDQVLYDGAVAYWRLGEPSGTTAASEVGGANYNGTISGGVTLGQPGAMAGNTAFAFDGANGKVTVGTSAPSLQITAGSAEAWAYPNILHSGGVVDKTEAGATNSGYLLYCSGGDWYWSVKTDTALYYITTPVTLARWTHLLGTYDGSTLRFYLNGVLKVTGPGVGAIHVGVGTLLMGMLGSAIYPFNGRIDEVSIYPTVLTAAQVAQHFDAGIGGHGGAPTEFRSRYRWRDAA